MKVLILGNGVAGNTAASVLRRLDAEADITIVSDEPFPEYTACALPHYIAGEFPRKQLFLRSESDYSSEGIKTIFGKNVTAISPAAGTISLNNETLSYDRLIIATGSRPVIPPIPGVTLRGVFTLKSPADADAILSGASKTAVVIGSGPVGVETAIALRKRGLEVFLIESLERILPRIFDAEPSAMLRDVLKQNGIQVLTGERVSAILGSEKVESIITDKREIKCDQVVLSVGMRPNVELARAAGVSIGALGGIAIDRRMRTNFENIFACGDCVQTRDIATGKEALIPLWNNAKKQGLTAGYNCAGISRVYAGAESITSFDVYGTHAVSFGRIASEDGSAESLKVVERMVGENYYRLVIDGERVVGAQSIGDSREMGALLYAMIKRERLSKIRRIVEDLPLPENPLYHRAAQYFNLLSIKV